MTMYFNKKNRKKGTTNTNGISNNKNSFVYYNGGSSVDLSNVYTQLNSNSLNISRNSTAIENIQKSLKNMNFLKKDGNDNNGKYRLTLGSMYSDTIATTSYNIGNGTLIAPEGIWIKGISEREEKTTTYTSISGETIAFSEDMPAYTIELQDKKGFTIANATEGATATINAGLTKTNGISIIEEHLYYKSIKEMEIDTISTASIEGADTEESQSNDSPFTPVTPWDDYTEATDLDNGKWSIVLETDGKYNYILYYVAVVSATNTSQIAQSAQASIYAPVKYKSGTPSYLNATCDQLTILKANNGIRIKSDGIYSITKDDDGTINETLILPTI